MLAATGRCPGRRARVSLRRVDNGGRQCLAVAAGDDVILVRFHRVFAWGHPALQQLLDVSPSAVLPPSPLPPSVSPGSVWPAGNTRHKGAHCLWTDYNASWSAHGSARRCFGASGGDTLIWTAASGCLCRSNAHASCRTNLGGIAAVLNGVSWFARVLGGMHAAHDAHCEVARADRASEEAQKQPTVCHSLGRGHAAAPRCHTIVVNLACATATRDPAASPCTVLTAECEGSWLGVHHQLSLGCTFGCLHSLRRSGAAWQWSLSLRPRCAACPCQHDT